MGSNVSPYFGNKICRWLNDQADMPARPSALYIALFDGNPKTTGTESGADINATNPRQLCTFTNIASGTAHTLISNIDVDWGLSDGPATFSYVALFDDPTAGALYSSKPAAAGPVSVLTGSAVKFLSTDITFNIGADT